MIDQRKRSPRRSTAITLIQRSVSFEVNIHCFRLSICDTKPALLPCALSMIHVRVTLRARLGFRANPSRSWTAPKQPIPTSLRLPSLETPKIAPSPPAGLNSYAQEKMRIDLPELKPHWRSASPRQRSKNENHRSYVVAESESSWSINDSSECLLGGTGFGATEW